MSLGVKEVERWMEDGEFEGDKAFLSSWESGSWDTKTSCEAK
jgi:hypothetical protein